MAGRKGTYFVSDVHLGLDGFDPEDRENRFVEFLKGIPRDAEALYLLGDIWDFWYEYRDVIPREGARVIAQLINLMDAGVEVFFFCGNHDVWYFSFFEKLGMHKCEQPYFVELDGKSFCIGHGDGLGDAKWDYKLMLKVFRSKVAQRLFSTLHPWLAYRFAMGWSRSNRRKHMPYQFKGEDEPIYKFSKETLAERKVDFFVFGHFHVGVHTEIAPGCDLYLIKDWISGGQPYGLFIDGRFELHS